VGHKRRRFLSGRVQEEVVGLADAAGEFLDDLVVTGVKNGRTVYVDVLRRRLERHTRVPKAPQLGNAPAPETMYEAIIGARHDLEVDQRLQRAARLR
jgi:hypothetical protein